MDFYTCTRCKASDCKLWRRYQSFDITLLCAPCAAKDQNKSIEGIDADGRRPYKRTGRTDSIGWFVPAIPVDIEDPGKGFWGYTSVPDQLVEWWRGLPTLPKGAK